MDFACSIIRTGDELEAIASPWGELSERSTEPSPMATPTWLGAWWRIFGDVGGRSLEVAVFRDQGVMVGVVPLVRRAHWYRSALRFRRLEWLGTGEDESDAICSEYVAPLVLPGAEDAVARGFAKALARGDFGEWDELVLPAMDGGGTWPTRLARELRSAGMTTDTRTTNLAPRIELPATFEAYLESLSSSSRYLVRRSLRDFEAWAGEAIEVRRAASTNELELGRSVLMSLHDERPQNEGAFRSPRFYAFHERVMPALLDEGSLELLWICARGEPVAAIYDLVHRGAAYFYQSSRRVDLPRGLRPGIVMQAKAIERAIERGLAGYDLLGTESHYGRQLANSTRPLVTLRAVRPSVRERVREIASDAATSARRLVKDVRPANDPPAGVEIDPSRPTAVIAADLNVLRCFAGTDIPTLCVSSDPASGTFFSRHAGARRMLTDAKSDPDAAAKDLVSIGRVFSERPVLFYGDDAMLDLVSRNRDELARYYRFLLPERNLCDELLDKTRFAAFARERRLPTPRTVAGARTTSVREIVSEVGLPCVLKPNRSNGASRKLIVARDDAALESALERMRLASPSFVAEEWVAGGEDQVLSFHCYVRPGGSVLGHYVGRKLRAYPAGTGAGTFTELLVEPALVRLGLDIVERIGIVGIAKLDFKVDETSGAYRLLDVTPRYSFWNHLGAVSGVNLPLIAYEDQIDGPTSPPAEARTGTRWVSVANDARAFFQDYGPSGTIGTMDWIRSYRGEKVYDVFAWDDPSPFVMQIWRSLRERIARPGQ